MLNSEEITKQAYRDESVFFFLFSILVLCSTLMYQALHHGKIETQTSYTYMYTSIYNFLKKVDMLPYFCNVLTIYFLS